MDARLAKVRERKQLKQQVTEDEEEEEKKTTVEEVEGKGEGEGEAVDPIAAMINSELNQAREKAAKEVEEKEGDKTRPKKPYVRPWDKGKGVWSQLHTCMYMYMYMYIHVHVHVYRLH